MVCKKTSFAGLVCCTLFRPLKNFSFWGLTFVCRTPNILVPIITHIHKKSNDFSVYPSFLRTILCDFLVMCGFESCLSEQVHVVKMLSCPSSQCFQRIQGPRIAKSEGLEILLSTSRFPKQAGLAPTHLPSPWKARLTGQQNTLKSFLCRSLAYGPKGRLFYFSIPCAIFSRPRVAVRFGGYARFARRSLLVMVDSFVSGFRLYWLHSKVEGGPYHEGSRKLTCPELQWRWFH